MNTKKHTGSIHKEETNQHLLKMGWNSHFQAQVENLASEDFVPARVVGVRKNSFRLGNGKREWLAAAAGRLRHRDDGLYPVTGDWVLATDTVISRVLERKNALSRGAAGTRRDARLGGARGRR